MFTCTLDKFSGLPVDLYKVCRLSIGVNAPRGGLIFRFQAR